MKPLCRRPLARLVVLQLVLLFTLACGGTTCDCVTPLDAPMAEEAKLYDSIQARLTPLAFRFIEDNLPAIIAMFMEEGLSFEVPPSDEEFCMVPIKRLSFDFSTSNASTIQIFFVHLL